MKRIFLTIAVFTILAAVGLLCFMFFTEWQNPPIFYKGIESAPIPSYCEQFKDDACGLFDCMVDFCWCENPEAPKTILQQGNTVIENEQQAIAVVKQYVQSQNLQHTNVEKAVKINTVFWNVFVYNAWGDEKVFTVAADGTIIKTVCGV